MVVPKMENLDVYDDKEKLEKLIKYIRELASELDIKLSELERRAGE